MLKEILLFVVTFIFVYLFYFIFVLSRKNVFEKVPESKNMLYLKYKYGIKFTKKNTKEIANKVYLANSLILSITVTILGMFKSFILGLLVSMIPLILLILVFYHLIGTYYKKKQGGK